MFYPLYMVIWPQEQPCFICFIWSFGHRTNHVLFGLYGHLATGPAMFYLLVLRLG